MYLFMIREYKDTLIHMELNYFTLLILLLLYKVHLFQMFYLFLELYIIILNNLELLDG